MKIKIKTTANSTYKKLAVQWLNETLCFVSSFVVADSLVLRNRQLLVAAPVKTNNTKAPQTPQQSSKPAKGLIISAQVFSLNQLNVALEIYSH